MARCTGPFFPSNDDCGNVPTTYRVGDFIQTAWLQREGCSSLIVHRWPDVAGARVDPDAGDALPAICEGSSVQASIQAGA